MKLLLIFFSALILIPSARAQRLNTTKSLATRKPASDNSADSKLILAKQFIELGGMKKELEVSVQGGDVFLERLPKEKDTRIAAENKKIYAAAKTKWSAKKTALPEQLTEQLQKELANAFTDVELKYLVELSKSSVYKKYRTFLESDTYTKFYARPIEVARETLEETKKEFAAQGSAKKMK